MPPIRFIHAADLHLDAAFSGLSRDIPADFAERLRTATFTAFRRLLDLCERESPDFLLLAGDVYNQEDASVSAQLALRDGFRRLESLSIPVFFVHGNHDSLASRLRSVRWPGNVTVFGELPDAVPVFRKGEGTPLAIIHGASHASGRETRNLAALFRRTEACGLHVGLLHATPGDADGVARYAPFSQEDLKASGMDYWALGHIHDRREVCREPLAAYPGCTQGLHINEPGEKGCLLVTAEAGPMAGMRCARPSVPSALRFGRRWIWIWAALLRWMNWKTGLEPDWIARLPRSGPAAKCCLCGCGCKDARNWTGCCARGQPARNWRIGCVRAATAYPGSGSRIST